MLKQIEESYPDLSKITRDHLVWDPIFKDLCLEDLAAVIDQMDYKEFLCIPGSNHNNMDKAKYILPFVRKERTYITGDRVVYFRNKIVIDNQGEKISIDKILSVLNSGKEHFYWNKDFVLYFVNFFKKELKEANITIVKEKAPKKQKSTSGTVYISRIKAASVMEEAGGKFFTVVFIKKDATERTMNCQYLKNQGYPKLGYIKVKEMSKIRKGESAIRNINMQTLISITMGKTTYIIK